MLLTGDVAIVAGTSASRICAPAHSERPFEQLLGDLTGVENWSGSGKGLDPMVPWQHASKAAQAEIWPIGALVSSSGSASMLSGQTTLRYG